MSLWANLVWKRWHFPMCGKGAEFTHLCTFICSVCLRRTVKKNLSRFHFCTILQSDTRYQYSKKKKGSCNRKDLCSVLQRTPSQAWRQKCVRTESFLSSRLSWRSFPGGLFLGLGIAVYDSLLLHFCSLQLVKKRKKGEMNSGVSPTPSRLLGFLKAIFL